VLFAITAVTTTAIGVKKYLAWRIRRNERAAVTAVRTISVAQNIWRSSDYDGNGVHDYARRCRDLYYQEVDGEPVALIPKELADACGPDGKPYRGYLFGDLIEDAAIGFSYTWQYEYGHCAWPARRGWTRVHTFVTNEAGTIFHKDRGPETGPLSVFPLTVAGTLWLCRK